MCGSIRLDVAAGAADFLRKGRMADGTTYIRFLPTLTPLPSTAPARIR